MNYTNITEFQPLFFPIYGQLHFNLNPHKNIKMTF